MWKFKAVLIGVLGVLMISGLAKVSDAKVVSEARVISVSGEISSIDVKLGKLELAEDSSRNRRDPVKYNINKDATRVTDPTDKKFLKLEDLRVGQHVKVEFNYIPEELVDQEPVAQKIIAEPMPEPIIQEVSGELKSIDAQSGTFTIEEKPGTGNLAYFVYEPKDIIVMQSPSMEPVRLALKPGDLVKAEFVVKGGNRYARSITLYPVSPVTASTTTTTTTSTTVTH